MEGQRMKWGDASVRLLGLLCIVLMVCGTRTASQRNKVNRTSFDVWLDTRAPLSAAPPRRHLFTAIVIDGGEF